MLDGRQSDLKTYMAADEDNAKAVTFQAIDKDEAKKMLIDGGLDGYKIVWESTPMAEHIRKHAK